MTQANAPSQVRLRFAKRGDLRLVSHHDIMRCVERMVRRAKVPLATTQGFNPRPKIVFASALGLGVEALREVVDLELTEPIDADEVLRRLAAAAPPGFSWLEARNLTPGESPPRPQTVTYQLDIPADRIAGAASALATLLESSSRPYQRRRPDRTVSLDLRPFLIDADLTDHGRLRFRLKVTPDGTARGEEIVEALGLSDLLDGGAILVRADVELVPSPVHKHPSPARGGSAPPSNSPGTATQPPAPIPDATPRPADQPQTVPGPTEALAGPVPATLDPLGRPDGT
jgi:radical SAM-linked protein